MEFSDRKIDWKQWSRPVCQMKKDILDLEQMVCNNATALFNLYREKFTIMQMLEFGLSDKFDQPLNGVEALQKQMGQLETLISFTEERQEESQRLLGMFKLMIQLDEEKESVLKQSNAPTDE